MIVLGVKKIQTAAQSKTERLQSVRSSIKRRAASRSDPTVSYVGKTEVSNSDVPQIAPATTKQEEWT